MFKYAYIHTLSLTHLGKRDRGGIVGDIEREGKREVRERERKRER